MQVKKIITHIYYSPIFIKHFKLQLIQGDLSIMLRQFYYIYVLTNIQNRVIAYFLLPLKHSFGGKLLKIKGKLIFFFVN